MIATMRIWNNLTKQEQTDFENNFITEVEFDDNLLLMTLYQRGHCEVQVSSHVKCAGQKGEQVHLLGNAVPEAATALQFGEKYIRDFEAF